MRQFDSPTPLRHLVRKARCNGQSVGLIPTMGFLHAGHKALIQAARELDNLVVVSIYVNPTQFGPNEDFERYPRNVERDLLLAESAKVDAVFLPSDAVMYPDGAESQMVWIDPGALQANLDGRMRPGHFKGVSTVVAKLFGLVQPDRAYFGQKDAQQVIVIKRMVRDLSMGVDVRAVPTVREQDGLALSSRNVYLSRDERAQAPALYEALQMAKNKYAVGDHETTSLIQIVRDHLSRRAPLGDLEFAEVVTAEAAERVTGPIDRRSILAVAIFFGRTRLIDNVELDPFKS